MLFGMSVLSSGMRVLGVDRGRLMMMTSGDAGEVQLLVVPSQYCPSCGKWPIDNELSPGVVVTEPFFGSSSSESPFWVVVELQCLLKDKNDGNSVSRVLEYGV